jgi:hypothetical protein
MPLHETFSLLHVRLFPLMTAQFAGIRNLMTMTELVIFSFSFLLAEHFLEGKKYLALFSR